MGLFFFIKGEFRFPIFHFSVQVLFMILNSGSFKRLIELIQVI